ncbi:unnamed protein product [Callosobruchus maculatus]|uniref:protein-histidine N-methyltransferase n=1 Tax=Callosobruchus maculatus TaxID=64391 RepID=A0A653C2I0_CALMS|nr:unnamed protein product [Callosobruchus maculatus]
MSRGIASEFQRLFGQVDELKRQGGRVGQVLELRSDQRRLYYLISKEKSYQKPTYRTVWEALLDLREKLLTANVLKLAIPRLACGRDGLDWRIIRNMLEVLSRFVYEDNVHDGYWLKLGISKSDPLQEKRNDLLSRLTWEPTDRFFIKKGPEPIDGHLLAFLRIFNMNEEQLDHWLLTTPLDQLENSKCILDSELDKKVWKFLQTRLKLLQALYKTSLQEDIEILKRKDLTNNTRLAIRMRMSEKMIFEDALQYVNRRISENEK